MGEPLGRFVANGFIGGLFSAVGGHSFQSGFFAAGFGSLAGSPTGDFGHDTLGTIEAAVLGGIGSSLGGGKFANGAVTGAFAYAASGLAEDGPDEDGPNQSDPARSDSYGNKYGPPTTGTIDCGSTQCHYQYQTVEDYEGFRGARLYVSGNGEGTKWIQTYSDNGATPVPDCEYSPCPFASRGSGKPFLDSPRNHLTFMAETSLVQPNQHGGYDAIITFKWGFRLSPSSITLLPLREVAPYRQQSEAIASAHQ